MQAGHDMKNIAFRATPMLAALMLLACSSPMPVWAPPPARPPSQIVIPPLVSAPRPAPEQTLAQQPSPADSASIPFGAASGPSESAAVAARFPDPVVNYATPAFQAGHNGYTSNGELRSAIHQIVDDAYGNSTAQTPTSIRLIEVGSSQTGVPLEALYFSREPVPLASTGATVQAARPTVMLIGQQHGDEPAGSEALLIVAQQLASNAPGGLAAVLDRVNVVVLPRANPDGALAGRRATASGIDMNRDHLLLRTPEAQAIATLARQYDPAVVIDSHEYSVLGRYVEKFGGVQRFDALIQYAMVANLPAFVSKASSQWFRDPMLAALHGQGLTTEWYYTTSTDLADKKVSMGGVQPDTGRNVYGLRNAVSFLIETRGIDLGRAHLARRVQTQVVAVSSALKSAAIHADDLQKLRHFVAADVTAQVCKGETIVEAGETSSEYNLLMLDPQSGADKTITVSWDSALELTTIKRRVRPCGYWLGADQTDAALRLRALGVTVQHVDEPGSVRGEAYSEIAREIAPRDDVRGTIADGGGVLRLKVGLVPALLDVPAGSYYVGLDQPLANLVIAAMEPDTQNSFTANRIVSDVKSEARVLALPDMKMTPMQ
jgi:hypothetical protein